MENPTNNSIGHPVNDLQVKEKKPTSQWNFGSFLSSVLLLGLVDLLAWGMSNNRKGQVDQGSAPDFSVTSFDGETLTLSELGGQVVVINFWAAWCPSCREEAPYLEKTLIKYKSKGVVFIGVNYVDTEPEALPLLKNLISLILTAQI